RGSRPSTLLPYTTLFDLCQPQRLAAGLDRRLVFVREHLVARRLTEHGHLDARRRSVCDERTRILERGDRLLTSALLPEDVRAHQDRKSTRLNSSHLGISY